MTIDRSGTLPNSPLIFAAASIRFAAWPLMTAKIAEIHDQLRDITPIIQHIQIQAMPANLPGMQQDITSAWSLLAADRSFGFQFAQDQLLFFSKKYSRFTDFHENLNKGLAVLFKEMRFMDIENLGVRYVDHIRPSNNETVEDYVMPSLLPATFSGLKTVGGNTAWIYLKDQVRLRVRGNCQPSALAFPEDLIGLLVMTQEPSRALEIDVLKPNEFLLDMDATLEYSQPTRIDESTISDYIERLHIETHQFFRHENVCTEHAFKIWKGEVPK